MVNLSVKGETGSVKGETRSANFWQGKVQAHRQLRIFGKGKCEFIANFSATMVTSLPSLSVCISLSLSHRKYLTHNIGSASALPIISAGALNSDFTALLKVGFLNVQYVSVIAWVFGF